MTDPGRAQATKAGGRELPAPTLRDLPEAVPLRRAIGPGVVLLAVGLGTGEYVLWPYIGARAGVGLLWLAVIGLFTQYVINMEIERYTLATGETAVTGFTRLWRHWAWIFLVFTIVPWAWPGWASGASTTLGFVFGWGPGAVDMVAALGLVAIGVALTLSPSVYRTVERFQATLVGILFLFLVAAVFVVTDAATWTTVVTDLGYRAHPDITPALLLGVVAFAGAGGTLNLTLSNWIRDKGMGMGAHISGIESPVTSRPSVMPSVGHAFSPDEENMRRWRGWWRVANQENFVFFFLFGLLAIAALSVTAASLLYGQEIGRGFDFIRAEGEALGERVGPWLRTGFWLSGTALLFATNLGILDHVGRVIADIVKLNWLPDSRFWTESALYVTVVWTEILIGSAILLLAISAPMRLLIIAGSLNGIVMLVYTVLLIRLNRTALPDPVKVRGFRLWAMIWSVALFAYLSVFLIFNDILPPVAAGGP